MKNICVALAFTFLSGGVFAEWQKAGESGNLTIYVDTTTARMVGSSVKLWTLSDFKKPIDGARSIKNQVEFDCSSERMRSLFSSGFKKQMGNGDVTYTETTPLEWLPIVPGTIFEQMYTATCDVLKNIRK